MIYTAERCTVTNNSNRIAILEVSYSGVEYTARRQTADRTSLRCTDLLSYLRRLDAARLSNVLNHGVFGSTKFVQAVEVVGVGVWKAHHFVGHGACRFTGAADGWTNGCGFSCMFGEQRKGRGMGGGHL